jgi:hypothetical protein
MPQAIGLALAAVASNGLGLLGASVALQAGAASFAAGLGGTVIGIGVSVGLAYVSVLLGTKARPPSPQDVQSTITSSTADRTRTYGRGKLGGVRLHAKAEGGFYYQVFALCAGEIDVIEEHWIDDAEVVLRENGDVDTGTYVYQDVPRAHIEKRLGTASQTAYSGIPDWGGDFYANGIASVYFRLQQTSQNVFADIFPNGAQTRYRAVVRGVKVPDPALGNNGVTESGNFSWSDNAARVLLDYLIHPDGLGLDPTWITNSLAEWQTAVSICDEVVSLKGGGATARYRIYDTYSFAERPADVIERMLAACDGQLIPTQNHGLALFVGKWSEPTVTIDDRAILSYEDIGRGRDVLSTANVIKATFLDPANDYQATDADPWEDTADIVARGEFVADVAMTNVPTHSQARRLMKLMAARANPNWVGTLTCNALGLAALGERFIRVEIDELGISETFEVVDQPQFIVGDGSVLQGVKISVASLSSAAYAWDAAEEEGEGPIVGTVSASDNAIAVPTGLTLSNVQIATGGGVAGAVEAEWDALSPDWLRAEVRFRQTFTTTWASLLADVADTSITTGVLEDGQDYEFQIRGVSSSTSRTSEWSGSVTITVIADPVAPAVPTGLSVTGGAGEATVNLTAPGSANFSRAVIYRAASASFVTATVAGSVYGAPNASLSFTDTGLAAGTWFYWATAANGSAIESAEVGPVSDSVS